MRQYQLLRIRTLLLLAGFFLLFLLGFQQTSTAQNAAIEVRLYRSVAPGINRRHALGFTNPMVELLSRNVNYSINFDFEEKQTLMEFGEDVSKGRIGLGVLWGLEYGWLAQKYPKLKMMCVASQGGKAGFPIQFIVPRDRDVREFAELRGLRLATFDKESPMIRLYRDKAIRDFGFQPKSFFKEVIPYANPKDAIFAVKRGEADVMVTDAITWIRFTQTHPQGKEGELVPFLTSEPMPEGVIFGRPELVNNLRPELWTDLKNELAKIHNTPEGKQCVEFWGVDSFDDPEKHKADELIERRLRDYPFSEEE